MLLLFTQMDKSIPFLVVLFIVGFLIISLDVFPSQWNKLNNNKLFGGHLIKFIKGKGLKLIRLTHIPHIRRYIDGFEFAAPGRNYIPMYSFCQKIV